MQFSKMKKFFASALVVSLLVVAAAFVASAAYTKGSVPVMESGWVNGKFTTTGSNSVPTNGTWTITGLSTGVSVTKTDKYIYGNTIWGKLSVNYQGMTAFTDKNITHLNYSGNRVTYAEWLGKACTVYGQ